MIKSRLHAFLNEQSFRNNFARVASGAVLGQAVAFLALPILSRLFFPADFAVLAAFVAAHALVISFITMRFEWMAPNAKNEDEAAELLNTAFLSTLAWCTILVLPVLFFVEKLRVYFPDTQISNALLILLFFSSILLAAIRQILLSWLVYTGMLKPYAAGLLFQTLMTTLFGLLVGYFARDILQDNGLILIIAFNAGILTSCAVMVGGVGFKKIAPLFKFAVNRALGNAKKNSNLAITSTGVSIMNAISLNANVFVIAFLFGDTVLGLYALAHRIAFAPTGFVSTAMASSFWAEAARLSKTSTSELKHFYIKTLKRLAVFGGVICLIMWCVSLFLDSILGTDNWDGAGNMVVTILPFVFASIVIGSTTHLIVYSKQKYQLFSDGLGILGSAGAMTLFNWLGFSPHISILAGVFMIVVSYVIRCGFHFYANKNFIITDIKTESNSANLD